MSYCVYLECDSPECVDRLDYFYPGAPCLYFGEPGWNTLTTLINAKRNGWSAEHPRGKPQYHYCPACTVARAKADRSMTLAEAKEEDDICGPNCVRHRGDYCTLQPHIALPPPGPCEFFDAVRLAGTKEDTCETND